MRKFYYTLLISLLIGIQLQAQLQNINNGIHIPGVYNFEQLNLLQIGNGACGLELINHTDLVNSYGVRLKVNTDDGINGLQIQTANSTNTYSSISYSTKMVINTSGNIGIGTTQPGYKLDILTTSGIDPLSLKFNNGGTITNTHVFYDDGNSGTINGNILLNAGINTKVKLSANDISYFLFSALQHPKNFYR